MHIGHPHGSCGDCASFVEPFIEMAPRRSGILAWGYCRAHTPEAPAGEVLEELVVAYTSGNRLPLRENEVGLFKAEEDDCCDFYAERE